MSREHIAGAAACQGVIDRRALRLLLHDRRGKVIGPLAPTHHEGGVCFLMLEVDGHMSHEAN